MLALDVQSDLSVGISYELCIRRSSTLREIVQLSFLRFHRFNVLSVCFNARRHDVSYTLHRSSMDNSIMVAGVLVDSTNDTRIVSSPI